MDAARNRGLRRACDAWLVLAFALAIFFVPLKTLFEQTSASATPAVPREFRALAKLPAEPESLDDALAWPQRFDAWFRDHFAGRSTLIAWHNLAKIELFEVSPTSEIVLGPGHWMYTTRDRAVDVFRGADPFTQEELDLWVRVLEDRREWCAQRGVKYLFAIATNKETVYPENFPARFDKIGPTRREQLTEAVRARSDFPLLDLTEALLSEKARRGASKPIFFPLGTHWNDIGAVAAYRALIERVAELDPRVKPRPESDFTFAYTPFQDDSWAGRLYLEDRLVQDNDAVEFARAIPSAWWEEGGRIHALDVATPDRPDSGLPRAVMFHDSMGEKLRPLVAEHFRSVRFKWVASDFDADLIEQEKPDVVIQLFVERALAATSLSNSPMDTQERLAAEFAASQRSLDVSSARLLPSPSSGARSVSLEHRSDGRLIVHYGLGPVELPEMDVPAGSWPIVRFEIEAPAPTVLGIEFLTRRFETYSSLARGFTRPLAAGRSTLYVKLRVPELAGRVRFHFGGMKGDYVVHALEARAVPQ